MKISAACQLCNVRSVTVEHHLYKLDCVRLTAMRDCILPSQPYTVELVYNDHRWSCDRVVVIDKWSFKTSLGKMCFFQDFQNNNHVWDAALCNKDSDGDGKTNGEELGDPNCQWTPTGSFRPSRATGHPGKRFTISPVKLHTVAVKSAL